MYRKDIISGMQSMIDRNSDAIAEWEWQYLKPLSEEHEVMLRSWRHDQTVMKRALAGLMGAWG